MVGGGPILFIFFLIFFLNHMECFQKQEEIYPLKAKRSVRYFGAKPTWGKLICDW